jgi:hypothetical protein
MLPPLYNEAICTSDDEHHVTIIKRLTSKTRAMATGAKS